MIAEPTSLSVSTTIGTVAATHWPSSGRPIVLIHGLTAEQDSWGPLPQMLAANHEILTVDLRGHGSSSWATWDEHGYTAAAMAEDVQRVCSDAAISGALVVGHSLGARVAMSLVDVPGLVAGVALSDTFPVVGEKGARWANDQIGERLTLPGLRSREDAAAWLRERHPEWNEPWAPLLAGTHFRENWAGRWVFRCDPQLLWLLRGNAARAEASRVRDLASRVRQPALLLWGRESPLVEEVDVRESLPMFPNAELQSFPTGHYIMREDEAAWVEVVHDFADRLP